MLVDEQTYFENHHHRNNYYHENGLNQSLQISQFYLGPPFDSAFVAKIVSFVFKSESFTRLQVWDLLTNFFVLLLHQVYHWYIYYN